MNDSVTELKAYDPRATRKELGVDQNVLLAPQKPKPVIIEGTMLEFLSHTGVFSADDCHKLILDNEPQDWEPGYVNASAADDSRAEKTEWRHSKNVWLERTDNNLWVFDKMLALVMAANQRFQFEVDFFEALQLAKYEEGMFYDWHMDVGPGIMGNRKLSVTVQLSPPDSYEGGDLILDAGNYKDHAAPRELGSVTVFPSFMKHRVTPVTKGTRYSLVVWASGTQRFR